MATEQPWYTFSWLENFGTIDPQGNYWKPDVNVQAPGGYPITALFPGTVTSVQQTSWGQNVVTVKLDQALNYLATHTFYEHLSSSNVQVGQHVNTGSLIGYNNASGQVPVGFGFYSGDIYGSGSAWQTLQRDLAPGGQGLLNPGKLLNIPEGGHLGSNFSSMTGGATTSGSTCAPWDIPCVVQEGMASFFGSDFFTQSIIVTVAIILGLIGVVVLVFGHGSEQGTRPVPVPV